VKRWTMLVVAGLALLCATPASAAIGDPYVPGPPPDPYAQPTTSCPDPSVASVKFRTPTQAVPGKRYTGRVDEGESTRQTSSVQLIEKVELVAAGPQPIFRPAVGTWSDDGESDWIVDIQLEEGDGPAVVRVTVMVSLDDGPCTAVVTSPPITVLSPTTAPACEGGTAAYRVSIPPTVAYGREGEVKIVRNAKADASDPDITITSKSPSAQEGNVLDDAGTGTHPVSFRRGDPPAQAVVRWFDHKRLCNGSVRSTITPIEGDMPRIAWENADGVLQIYPKAGRCSRTRPGKITVTVRGDGQHRRANLGDPCQWRRLNIAPHGRRNYTTRFRYEGRFNGKRIARGTIVARTRYRPGFRIYETDFDRYVNYCINEGKKIRASGGLLYCTVPPQLSRTYRKG